MRCPSFLPPPHPCRSLSLYLQDTALEPVRVSDRCKREVCNQVFRARLRIATRVVPNPATLFAGVRQDIYRNLADSSVFYQFFMSNVGDHSRCCAAGWMGTCVWV